MKVAAFVYQDKGGYSVLSEKKWGIMIEKVRKLQFVASSGSLIFMIYSFSTVRIKNL